ncbi:MAG TPA: penicillin-binding protein activator [Steroidobacteraceae bacterium]
MLVARWIVPALIITAAACALSGCPSLSPRTQLPPSIDAAEALAGSGDQAGAARIYEQLAAQNSGADRNDDLLRAARAYLDARRPEDAARVLADLEPAMPARQTSERALLETELSLARAQPTQAWQWINSTPEPHAAPDAPRYLALKQRAALASGRLVEAVAAQVSLERWLGTARELRQSRVNLLNGLRDASARGVKVDPRTAPDATVRGWLELGPIAATAARNPNAAIADVDAWRSRYPNHPAADVVRSELLRQSVQQERLPAPRSGYIALLLPLSGRQSAAGSNVRDGFMTAYYQTATAQRAPVRVYDTADGGIAQAITSAAQQGAAIIVGPLTREEVIAAAMLDVRRPPLLALNFLPPERPAPQEFYQYALSPEEEARIVARRILGDGHHHGVSLVPAGDWGTRVLTAFTQELQAGGGSLFASATIDAGLTDYADPITQVLRISDSNARYHRLQSVLGTKLQFEPRRRGDVEFIFAPASAPVERLLRPQLRFHFAGDVPTYATSDAFEPDPRNNQDLEGLMFPDMPWMLGSELAEAVRAAVREAWPSGGPRRGRLFAFGFDAYRLAMALLAGDAAGELHVDGLTGKLTLDQDHRVHRELEWAQIHNGELRLLPSP